MSTTLLRSASIFELAREILIVCSTILCVFLLMETKQAIADDANMPNVFFITIDTLRADHLGSYGYDRGTSPHIDAFASSAML